MPRSSAKSLASTMASPPGHPDPADMSGSGNLGVHPLRRADQDDPQFWTSLPEIHGNAAPPGEIIASHFAQVRRTLEHGSAPDL